jgi:hypothetical protein
VGVLATPTLDTATGVTRFLTVNLVMVAAALLARWFVPFLPSTATLDGLATARSPSRSCMWTVGTIAGAMWAEQSWGRFWGWDPEGDRRVPDLGRLRRLPARPGDRGVKGRGAAWIGSGLRRAHVHLPDRQLRRRRAALLRRAVSDPASGGNHGASVTEGQVRPPSTVAHHDRA